MPPIEFYAIVPHKFVLAISSTLVILMTINAGGTPSEVSLIVTLLIIGNLLGSIAWAKLVTATRKYLTVYIGGYAGLFLALILLLTQEIYVIAIAAFIIPFMSSGTYYSALFLIYENYKDKMGEMIGLFESVGGWAWVLGLGFGIIATGVLSATLVIIALSTLSFLAIFLTAYIYRVNVTRRIIEGLKKDLGLLPLLDMALDRIIEVEEVVVDRALVGLDVVVSGNITLYDIYFKFRWPKELIRFYLSIFTVFLGFGLVFSQFITIQKSLGFTDPMVYGISLISSAVAATLYSRVGRAKDPRKMLIRSYVLRIILFILLLMVFFIEPIYSLMIFMLFSLIDGYTWAYISTLLNIVAIRYSKEHVGFSNFIRNMGYVAGASLSGIIIPLLGYQMNIILAIIALGVSTAIFIKSKVE